MRLSGDLDAMRFVGECTTLEEFRPDYIQCLLCKRRMEPEVKNPRVSLLCSGCGNRATNFNSEPEMKLYIAGRWRQLRQDCGHASASNSNDAVWHAWISQLNPELLFARWNVTASK